MSNLAKTSVLVGRGASFAPAVLLTAALACTPFEDGEDELGEGFGSALTETTASGTSSATTPPSAAAGANWSCLSRPALAPPASTAGATRMVYSLQVVEMATRMPISPLQVRVCGLTDLECERPVVDFMPVGADGWVDVPLFVGFTGYLEVTGPDVVSGVIVLSDPLTEDTVPRYPYLVLSQVALVALSRAIDIPLDPELGIVSIRAFDCQGRTAPGVELTTSGPGNEWYFVGGLPSAVEERTDPEGWGGFANSPPGLAQVDVLTADGVSISGTLNLMVRPGWVTHSFVLPSREP